jgi:polyphosphate glucokinase
MPILAVDVGGTHTKVLLEGHPPTERRRFPSTSDMSAALMVERVLELAKGWEFDRVSVGVPAPVVHGRVVHDPVNLGPGWVGFDFAKAFGHPTKVVNDAVMQAIGSYEGGRMLFLGVGTGLGTAMIVDGKVEALELGHMPFRKMTFEDYVGRAGRKRLGQKRWRKAVIEMIDQMSMALEPETIVVGGGLADKVGPLPDKAILGGNEHAFVGGFRLWSEQ